MTRENQTCKLCRERPATKKSSHIVPRFLGVSILKAPDGNHRGYEVNGRMTNTGKAPESQDTPKEDYILCPTCESGIGEWERQFANYFFHRVKTEDYCRQHPDIASPNGYYYRRIEGVEYKQFKLAWYSIFWRATISLLPYFADLRPAPGHVETLRAILCGEMDFVDLPLVVFTADSDIDPTKNVIYAISKSEDESIIWANEYLAFLNHEPGSDNRFADIALTDPSAMRLGILKYSQWHGLRKDLFNCAAESNID